MATTNMTMAVQGTPVSELENVPKTEEEWIAFVENNHTYLSGFKRGLERHWNEALLFLTNEQWIRFDGATNRFQRHNLDSYIPTPQTNKLTKTYDRVLDILTSPDFRAQGVPASEDVADKGAAEVATRSLAHLFRELDTEETYSEAGIWLIATGNCALYANWNPKAGVIVQMPRESATHTPVMETVAYCPSCGDETAEVFAGQQCPRCSQAILSHRQQPAIGSDGQEVTDTSVEAERDEQGHPMFDEIKMGEVTEDAVNMFNWYPQPRESWKKVMYCEEEIAMDLDEIVTVFGSKARKVNAEDVEVDSSNHFLNTPRSHYFDQNGEAKRAMARVRYFRHKPSDKFSKGKYLIVANSVLLYEGDIDTSDGELPYHTATYRKIPGQMWGIGPFLDLIPLQKRLNAIDSHIILNRKTMVNPQWTIPQGSGVTFIDGRPGLLIRYNPHNSGNHRPQKEPGIGLPPQVTEERNTTAAEIEDIGGTQEVLTGQAPAGVEAGVALNLLQEQAYRRFGPMMRSWRRMIKGHERFKMLLQKDNYDERRTVSIMGPNAETEVYYYSGADFGNTNDVIVGLERGLLFTESAQQQKLMMAADKGYLGDNRDPKIRGKLLEELGVPGFETEYNLDAKKARRVLEALKQGQQPDPPLPFDVHPIHFQVLTDYAKTSDFEALDEPVRNAIIERIMMHQQAMQQEAQQAQEAALVAKGTSENVSNQVAESGAFGDQPQTDTQQLTAQ